MKPFNLEQAIAGSPICLLDGEIVEFIAYVPKAKPNQRVVVRIGQNIHPYYSDGISEYCMQHLYMTSNKRTVWVNLYSKNQNEYKTNWHDSEAHANFCAIEGKRLGNKAWPLEIED